jgi:hypothetical protein
MPNMILPNDLARELREKAKFPGTGQNQDAITSALPQFKAPRGSVTAPHDSAAKALIEHEQLMQEFLASQQRCIEALLGGNGEPDQAEVSDER